MTKAEAKQVAQALGRFVSKVEVVMQPDGVAQIVLPFKHRAGYNFYLYAFKRPRSKKIFISDGGALVAGLKSAGVLQLKAIQTLMGTYGLSLMEDLSVMDITNRSLSLRLASFLQAWIAIDGVMRMWEASKEITSVQPAS